MLRKKKPSQYAVRRTEDTKKRNSSRERKTALRTISRSNGRILTMRQKKNVRRKKKKNSLPHPYLDRHVQYRESLLKTKAASHSPKETNNATSESTIQPRLKNRKGSMEKKGKNHRVNQDPANLKNIKK